MSRRYKHGMNWIRQEKRLAIYLRDNFACLYCGTGIEQDKGLRLALDHVKHWDGNDASNLVTCCPGCNRAKSCWSLASFLRKLHKPKEVERTLWRVQRALATDLAEFLVEAKAVIRGRREPF